MSTTSTAFRPAPRALAARPTIEGIVRNLALGLLAWSERRAQVAHPTPKELARIRADAYAERTREEQSVRGWASAPYRR